MDKRGFHAESTVERIDRTAVEQEASYNPLVFIIRLLVVIMAVVSGWFAFATPLLWWGVVGSLFAGVGLVSLRSRFKRDK